MLRFRKVTEGVLTGFNTNLVECFTPYFLSLKHEFTSFTAICVCFRLRTAILLLKRNWRLKCHHFRFAPLNLPSHVCFNFYFHLSFFVSSVRYLVFPFSSFIMPPFFCVPIYLFFPSLLTRQSWRPAKYIPSFFSTLRHSVSASLPIFLSRSSSFLSWSVSIKHFIPVLHYYFLACVAFEISALPRSSTHTQHTVLGFDSFLEDVSCFFNSTTLNIKNASTGLN